MDCPPGQKKVAVVERWPLVEVRLYLDRTESYCRCSQTIWGSIRHGVSEGILFPLTNTLGGYWGKMLLP